jgi:pimeloyl-ACP methyl ester carboxylesterase
MIHLMRLLLGFLLLGTAWGAVKQVPPPGIAVDAADRSELEAGLARLGTSIEKLKADPLVADVMIYHKAVRFALEFNEFYKPTEIAQAKKLLAEGQARADELAAGRAPWTSATGLVVRGYISRIDKSVQPYGLVIPPTFGPEKPHKWRLDTWLHGRGENLTEINFIADREKNFGEFQPRDTIVIHLYGRYCNANKFAGEVDLFEALADVKKHYNIDERRILLRGFSMGGAAVWHLAAHHAGEFAAASPGAGFAETTQYNADYRSGKIKPEWWEEKLFHLTNATDYALNFFNLPVVNYNGEIDPQGQAGDIMAKYMAEEGLTLARIYGPNTAHKYHPDSKIELSRIMDALAEKGNDPYPRKIRFTTWTLAYNQMKWVTVDGLEKHWERARVDAEITSDRTITVKTQNISALTLQMGPGGCPLDESLKPSLSIDGQTLTVNGPKSDRSWTAHLHKSGGMWLAGEETAGLRKTHGLQGPIDDAFLDSFVMVKPTGQPMVPGLAAWVNSEMEHAAKFWRGQFRGEAQIRNDTDISEADIANSNLVLWGDPGSNSVLKNIIEKLPLKWSATTLTMDGKEYPADRTAPVMVFPNPLNPRKYVVINSGLTFREFSNSSNALQVANLPDYAAVDISTPSDGKWPGKIMAAGFFGERWEWQAHTKR